jgi:hypothetical protein
MSGESRGAAVRTLRAVLLGAGRLVASWPGMLVVPIAYVATALSIYHSAYPNLWGLVASGAAGAAWYLSPLGRLEGRRRAARASRAAAP